MLVSYLSRSCCHPARFHSLLSDLSVFGVEMMLSSGVCLQVGFESWRLGDCLLAKEKGKYKKKGGKKERKRRKKGKVVKKI